MRNITDMLKEKKMSIAAISRDTGIPYSTIHDLFDGKTDIRKTSVGTALSISGVLGITIDELCRLLDTTRNVRDARIIVKNKSYYLIYNGGTKPIEKYLCKVTKNSACAISTIGEWALEDIKSEQEMDEWAEKMSNTMR